MAKNRKKYSDYKPNPIPKGKSQAKLRAIHLKIAKRVHADFKKKGIKSTWNESQKFASENLFQNYKEKPISKIRVTEIDDSLDLVLNFRNSKPNVPIKEIVEECGNVFKVPNELLDSNDGFWAIGNMIDQLPRDVKVRVSGGRFGSTGIAKAEEMDYIGSGIAQIVNAIRPEANNDSGTEVFWVGITKLVPGRPNDGKNCNYFIDFVLEMEGQFVEQFEQEVQLPNQGELTDEDIARLKLSKKEAEKESKKRREELKLQREASKEQKEKLEKAKSRVRGKESSKETKSAQSVVFDINKELDALREDAKAGLISKDEYRLERVKLIDLFEKTLKK